MKKNYRNYLIKKDRRVLTNYNSLSEAYKIRFKPTSSLLYKESSKVINIVLCSKIWYYDYNRKIFMLSSWVNKIINLLTSDSKPW